MRKNARVTVAELSRDISYRKTLVSKVKAPTKDSSTDDETLGRVQSSASKTAIKRAHGYPGTGCDILGAPVLMRLTQCVCQNLRKRIGQPSKPRLQRIHENRELPKRTDTFERFTQARWRVTGANDDKILQTVVRHTGDAPKI